MGWQWAEYRRGSPYPRCPAGKPARGWRPPRPGWWSPGPEMCRRYSRWWSYAPPPRPRRAGPPRKWRIHRWTWWWAGSNPPLQGHSPEASPPPQQYPPEGRQRWDRNRAGPCSGRRSYRAGQPQCRRWPNRSGAHRHRCCSALRRGSARPPPPWSWQIPPGSPSFPDRISRPGSR